MSFTRGAVTAGSLRASRSQPPPVRIPTVKSKVVPEGRTVGYISRDARALHIRIVAHEDIPNSAEMVRAVHFHHPQGVIVFKDWLFKSPHESVWKWLDALIKSGKLRNVVRDTQMLRMRCEFCDHVEPSTPKGMEDMAFHVMTAHDADENEYDEDDAERDEFFGDYDDTSRRDPSVEQLLVAAGLLAGAEEGAQTG